MKKTGSDARWRAAAQNTPERVPLFQNEFTASKRIIHTPSAFARAALPYLQEVGTLRAIQPHVSAREKLQSYLFFLVTDGAGVLEYGGNCYELHAGDCVFIDCRGGYAQQASNHRDASGSYDALWSLSWLHFDGASMKEIYDKYRERGGKAVFHCTAPKRYHALVDAVFQIVSSDSHVRDMQVAEKLVTLLTYLMEDAWTQEGAKLHSAPKRQLMREIKEYVDANYGEKLSLESLATTFFINKEYLSHVFKEAYGCTVNGYIAQVRVSRAKNLLRFSEESIEQIGAQVGVTDANYFSRMFKKIEGVSPSQYRASWSRKK